MALKRKITKEAFEALNDVLKAEYKEKDGAYFLDTDDAGELERANTRLKKDIETLTAERDTLKTERDELAASAGDKSKDIRTLENSWKQKLGETETQYKERITKLENQMRNTMLDSTALEISTAISNSPKLIYPHVRARLAADLEGEKPVIKVLDGAGQVSASSLDDLKQEFVANKDFASIIIGSKATGGNTGNHRQVSNGNPNANNNSNQPPNLAKMSPADLAAHMAATKQTQ